MSGFFKLSFRQDNIVGLIVDAGDVLKIGIVGLGVVGNAIYENFRGAHEIFIHDLSMGTSIRDVTNNCDFAYICVPTPTDINSGCCDVSAIESTLGEMPDGFSVAIKSTIIPGTTQALKKKYPEIKIACSPEFLRAAHSVEDFKNQKMLVVGTDDYKLSKTILNHHLDSGIDVLKAFFVVTPAQAEIVKYAMNTFYALKVLFGNKFQELTEIMGEDWSKIKQIITFPRDRGIIDTHLEDMGNKGFGGHCLPKDAFAFSKLLDDHGIDSNLIRTILSENRKYRKETE